MAATRAQQINASEFLLLLGCGQAYVLLRVHRYRRRIHIRRKACVSDGLTESNLETGGEIVVLCRSKARLHGRDWQSSGLRCTCKELSGRATECKEQTCCRERFEAC